MDTGHSTKLAICIPTHHGRMNALKELLESIACQSDTLDRSEVEICISDNASLDGTTELVREFQSRLPLSLKYFRFERDMRGVRNFVNVVDMANAEYCWLVGSDDMIPPDGVKNVLAALAKLPGVSAITFNKLNFDKSLEKYLGPDHDLVLPAKPSQSRMLLGLREIAQNLAMPFTFMSAHVFLRRHWQKVVEEIGIERLCATRHFPHSYIFLRIAGNEDNWYWLADYCVIQRMGNFCILEENSLHLSNYADELTHDLEAVWNLTIDSDASKTQLMGKLLLLYWNPVAVLIYLADSRVTPADQRRLRAELVRRFRPQSLFWITTYPMLWVPGILCRGIMNTLRMLDRVLPLRWGWGWIHTLLATMLTRLRRGDKNISGARSAASAYLSRNYRP